MKDLTYYRIAKELGLTSQAVMAWYSGKSTPTMKNMVKLSKLTCKTHEQLLEDFKKVAKKIKE